MFVGVSLVCLDLLAIVSEQDVEDVGFGTGPK